MANLTLRNIKGSALTFTELDSNFLALDSDITNLSTTLSGSYVTLGTNQTITGEKTFTGGLISDDATIANLVYPSTDGTDGQFLKTDGAGNLSFDTVTSYDSVKVQGQIDSDFTNTRTTTDLTEGTNLYYTDSRANSAIDARIDSDTFVRLTTDQTITGTKTFVGSTTVPAIILTSDDNTSDAAPILDLIRNTAQANNGDYLGQLKFKGEDSGGGSVVYAKITGKIADPTNATEDGLIEYAVKSNGSNLILARMTGNGGGKLILENGASLEVDTGIIQSNVTTGTAPLSIASTTLVSNLNADLLDGQQGSYYRVEVYDRTGTLLN